MIMSKPAGSRKRLGQIDPILVWRWGFAALLVVVGAWLVYARPQVGGASGRTLGWIMIGYAAVRFAVAYLGRRWSVRRRGEGPLSD